MSNESLECPRGGQCRFHEAWALGGMRPVQSEASASVQGTAEAGLESSPLRWRQRGDLGSAPKDCEDLAVPLSRADASGRVIFRQARAGDVEAIAALHADSWRRNYRGAFSDAFLDGDVTVERRTVWAERLGQQQPDHLTLVAVCDDTVLGFAHTVRDADPTWGALLDNLHVSHQFKRLRIGAQLLKETAGHFVAHQWRPALYLWVLEQNTTAQAFYESQGGRRVERVIAGPFPGGGHAPPFRYAWPDIAIIAHREQAPRR